MTYKEFAIAAFLSLIIIGSLGVIYWKWNSSSRLEQIPSEEDSMVSQEPADDAMAISIASTPYPPYYDEGLPQGGFVSEIVRTAFERAGYTVRIDFFPWERTLASAKHGSHDAVLAMWKTPEREEEYIFSSIPLPANELVFFGRSDTDIVTGSIDDLQGYTVGTVDGYSYQGFLDEHAFITEESDTLQESFRKLLAGRVDVVIEDAGVGLYTLDVMAASEQAVIIGEPVQVFDQYLVVHSSHPRAQEIIDTFDTSYQQMRTDGTYNTLLKEYDFFEQYGVE